MMDMLALIIVLLTGIYLVGLAVVSAVSPARAARFLGGFAGSALVHRLEILLRLIIGAALLLRAPHMLFSAFFAFFGWVLIITSVALFVVPWRWHHRFAQRVVPYAARNLALLAVGSLAFGGFVLVSVVLGMGPW